MTTCGETHSDNVSTGYSYFGEYYSAIGNDDVDGYTLNFECDNNCASCQTKLEKVYTGECRKWSSKDVYYMISDVDHDCSVGTVAQPPNTMMVGKGASCQNEDLWEMYPMDDAYVHHVGMAQTAWLQRAPTILYY